MHCQQMAQSVLMIHQAMRPVRHYAICFLRGSDRDNLLRWTLAAPLSFTCQLQCGRLASWLQSMSKRTEPLRYVQADRLPMLHLHIRTTQARHPNLCTKITKLSEEMSPDTYARGISGRGPGDIPHRDLAKGRATRYDAFPCLHLRDRGAARYSLAYSWDSTRASPFHSSTREAAAS